MAVILATNLYGDLEIQREQSVLRVLPSPIGPTDTSH